MSLLVRPQRKETLFKVKETKESCRCEEGVLPDEAISPQQETASFLAVTFVP